MQHIDVVKFLTTTIFTSKAILTAHNFNCDPSEDVLSYLIRLSRFKIDLYSFFLPNQKMWQSSSTNSFNLMFVIYSPARKKNNYVFHDEIHVSMCLSVCFHNNASVEWCLQWQWTFSKPCLLIDPPSEEQVEIGIQTGDQINKKNGDRKYGKKKWQLMC